jgi:hypothetical protein
MTFVLGAIVKLEFGTVGLGTSFQLTGINVGWVGDDSVDSDKEVSDDGLVDNNGVV